MITDNSVPVQDGNFESRNVGEETIIVSKSENRMHTLDMVGALIWKNIDGTKSIKSIIDIVCEDFDVERDRVESDTLIFIGRLVDMGLVKIS